MADTATTSPAPAATPKKTKAAAGSKKPRDKPAHPPTSDMVNAAIKNLKERGGSSLQAIKKYISANYKVDAEKMAPFIRKYLKSAVAAGALTQPKGKGATGSFKLSVKTEGKTAAVAKKPKVPKAKVVKKPKTASPKKVGGVKKTSATKKVAKPKSPSKAKKVAKPPTKKPKSPKPKKAALKKTKSPKKTAAKKK